MKSETDKKKAIPLYKERTFGDMVVVPFSFFSQELKGILAAVLKFAIPFFLFAIVLSIFFVKDLYGTFQFNDSSYIPNRIKSSFILIYIFYILASYVLNITIYHYIFAYYKHGKGNFSLKIISEEMVQTGLKIFGGSLLLLIFILPTAILFAYIPVVGSFLLIVLYSFFFVYLSLFPVITAFEKASIPESFRRSINLIKQNWWFSFGLYLVFIVITFITIYASMIPMVLVGVISAFTGLAEGNSLYVMIILFGFIVFIVSILLNIIMNIMLGLHYFNLVAKKDPNRQYNQEAKISEILNPKNEISNRFENEDDTNRFKN